jgi:hypothetical protein
MSRVSGKSHCIFCGSPYLEPSESCPSCNERFPWHSAQRAMSGVLGTPSSASSALTFREKFFAGLISVITTAALLTQTYVAHKQTEMIREQTTASQTERAQTLRARIAATHEHILTAQALASSLAWRFQEMPRCNDKCLGSDFFSLIKQDETTSRMKQRQGPSQARDLLAHIQKMFILQQGQLHAINGGPISAAQFFRQRLYPAITDCSLSPGAAKHIQATSTALPQIVSFIHGRERSMLSRQVSLMLLSHGENIPHWTTIEEDASYTMQRFSGDVVFYLDDVEDSIQGLVEACSSRLSKDQQALQRIEQQL